MAASSRTGFTNKAQQAALLIVGGALGLAMVWLVPADNLPLFLLQMFSALFIYVGLHEAGHAIAAVHQGFRLLTFSVWPMALQRRSGSWRVKWLGKIRAFGFVAADPVSAVDLRKRMIVFVAGGPIATAITALVAGLVVLTVRASWPHWAVDEINLIAFWSATSLVAGLIPYRGKLVMNDAARLQMLRRGGAEVQRFCSLLLLTSASRSGVRPRELNAELVAKLAGPEDGTVDWLVSALIRYNVLIDNGRIEEAFNAFHQVLNTDLDPSVRDVLNLQAACLEALFHRDLEAARAWMKAGPERGRKDDGYQNTLLRAKAAIAFLEHRYDDAEAAARSSLRHLDKIDDAGGVIVIRESIERLLAEIAEARANGSPDNAARADPIQSRR
jgi:hypothetical protein